MRFCERDGIIVVTSVTLIDHSVLVDIGVWVLRKFCLLHIYVSNTLSALLVNANGKGGN